MKGAIRTLFHLQRVHAVVPDAKLRDLLVAKLRALPRPSPGALDVSTATYALAAAAAMKISDGPFVEGSIDAVRHLLPSCTGRQLTRLLSIDAPFAEQLARDAAHVIAGVATAMSPPELAATAVCLARADVRDAAAWAAVADAAQRSLVRFTPVEVTRVAKAAAEVRLDHHGLFLAIERRTIDALHHFQGDEVLAILAAFERVGRCTAALIEHAARANIVFPQQRAGPGGGHRHAGAGAGVGTSVTAAFAHRFASDAADATTLTALRDATALARARKALTCDSVAAAVTKAVQLCSTPARVCDAPIAAASKVALPPGGEIAAGVALADIVCRVLRDDAALRAGLMSRCDGEGMAQLACFTRAVLMDALQAEASAAVDLVVVVGLLHSMRRLGLLETAAETLVPALVRRHGDIAALPLREFVWWFCAVAELPQGPAALRGEWVETVQSRIADFPVRATFGVITAVARVHRAAPCPAALEALFRHLLAITPPWRGRASAAGVLAILRAMQSSGVVNTELLLQACALVQQSPAMFSSGDMGVALQCAADVNLRDEAFFETVSLRVLSGSPSAAAVVSVLRVYASAQLLRRGVVSRCMAQLRVVSTEASAADVTVGLFAIAQLNLTNHTTVTSLLCDRATDIPDTFSPQQVTSVLNSMRVLKVAHEKLLRTFVPRLCEGGSSVARMAAFTPKQRASAMSCIAQLAPTAVTAMQADAFITTMLPAVHELSGPSLTAFVCAMVDLGTRRISAMLESSLAARCSELAPSLTAAQGVILLSCSHKLGCGVDVAQWAALRECVREHRSVIASNVQLRPLLRHPKLAELLLDTGSSPEALMDAATAPFCASLIGAAEPAQAPRKQANKKPSKESKATARTKRARKK